MALDDEDRRLARIRCRRRTAPASSSGRAFAGSREGRPLPDDPIPRTPAVRLNLPQGTPVSLMSRYRDFATPSCRLCASSCQPGRPPARFALHRAVHASRRSPRQARLAGGAGRPPLNIVCTAPRKPLHTALSEPGISLWKVWRAPRVVSGGVRRCTRTPIERNFARRAAAELVGRDIGELVEVRDERLAEQAPPPRRGSRGRRLPAPGRSRR